MENSYSKTFLLPVGIQRKKYLYFLFVCFPLYRFFCIFKPFLNSLEVMLITIKLLVDAAKRFPSQSYRRMGSADFTRKLLRSSLNVNCCCTWFPSDIVAFRFLKKSVNTRLQIFQSFLYFLKDHITILSKNSSLPLVLIAYHLRKADEISCVINALGRKCQHETHLGFILSLVYVIWFPRSHSDLNEGPL